MRRLFYILLVFTSLGAKAQVANPANANLKDLVASLTSIRNKLPIEKLYLQIDKPYYTLGDTLHFKSYLLNADFLTRSARSGLLYIELDNAANKMVKQVMVPITSGISWGDMALDEMEISEGSYTLRAYTNWMRNFGEDYIFKKNIYISALSGSSTLVNAVFKLDSIAGKNRVQASLHFTSMDKNPLRLKDMQLRVMNGRRTLVKDKSSTDMDGSMAVNFDVADKTSIQNLTIQAQQTGKGADTATLIVPVIISRIENTDVQFMPEGGNMVASILSKVGFKAIGEDGKATDINGKIVNSHQQEIVTIKSTRKGMGSFELTPQAGESYTAIINVSNKITKTYSLPQVKPAGTAIRVTSKGNDSLEVTLSATQNLIMTGATYYLIGQSRGVVCYAASIKFTETNIKKILSKELFPTGVTRFTLLDQNNQPLNERIVYIDHRDNLKVSVNSNKAVYSLRDSVALNVQVTDKDGKPVQGTFSLAVTDDSQVKPDSIGSNIINNLQFTSDLKGTVEEPGYFLENNTPERSAALDNLLLTQGWVGYDWKSIFNPKTKPPQYAPELEFTVQGKVTNVLNKPIKQTDVSLLQKQPSLILDTLTNDEGRFIFKSKNLFPTDTAYYLIQSKNKNGETFNIGVDIDEFVSPVFAPAKERLLPWYLNSDTTLVNNANTKTAQLKAETDYKGEGRMLKEVVINAPKLIPGSRNPYPPEQVVMVLDEKDMNAAKNLSLYELLKKRYGRNFLIAPYPGYISRLYWLYTRLTLLIIDGKYQPTVPTSLYMDYLAASDIRGIEVVYKVTSGSYDLALLYITTYSGKGGAALRHIPGRVVYRPLGFTMPQQFYRPRYTIKNNTTAMGTDLRSTIHWEPNVITDRDGKATVSFYSADKPADYTATIEGTDLNGNLGYSSKKIKVDQKK